jgi:hypothetical protein
VAQAVVSTPPGRRQYFERLGSLATNRFSEQAITNRVGELARRIRPTLAAYDPEAARRHDAEVASLCERISRRLQSVTEQLNVPWEPLSFEPDGTARLTRWWPRVGQAGASFQLQQTEAQGRPVLRVAVGNRGGTVSWRTRVFLEQGVYRFEGRARGGADGAGGQVCLRMSGARVGLQPLAGEQWVPLRYEFRVDGGQAEVELVCEFTGQRDEAWFDLESLRLVRE